MRTTRNATALRSALATLLLAVFLIGLPAICQAAGLVRLSGHSLVDDDGPFLGFGVTYMAAMWMCKYDRTNYQNDLAFLSQKGFNYIRILSEVPGACPLCYWYNRSICPVNYTCSHGVAGYAWSDYDQQFRDMLDLAYQYGLRAEVTIFGGAGDSFPTYAGREAHCQRILDLVAGREHKVIWLEVANEGWQTGFGYPQGVTDMRSLCAYLAARTSVPVAISATPWGSYPDPNDALEELYAGSAADIATEHFERDTSTFEGGWLPVRDCWRVEGAVGVPPCSSDEPIGPGSSVAEETDPIKLASAACFAWTAKLPSYVFHSRAGVRRDETFQEQEGINDLAYLRQIMPPDVADWGRNDGIETWAPFTVYCNNQANKYWTDFGTQSLPNGCHRNIGGRKDNQFVCYPQGILSGGLTLQAREQLTFTVYNPLTGAVVMGPTTKNPGDQFTLSQGPGAYIIKGTRPYGATHFSDAFAYANGALVGNGGWLGTATASRIEVTNQTVKLWGGAGSYDAWRSVCCSDQGTGYIKVSCKIMGCTGGRTMWNLWINDSSGRNLARWYGTGWSARGRIGDTADVTAAMTLTGNWDTIEVRIYPASDQSEFFFNGTSIGVLSHASQSAGDLVGHLRFESMDNWEAEGHCVYFDDLKVGEQAGDTTPPGPVTNFVATGGTGQNSLTWTNPTDPDFQGTMIRFKTTGYPTSPSDGTLIYNSSGTSFNHTGLTGGVTYYYAAYAHDAVPNYASAAYANATPTVAYCFEDLFDYPNGALVGNGGWTGSAPASRIEVVDTHVRIWGGAGYYYALRTMNCGDPGVGYIWVKMKIHNGVGARTIWSVRINDSAGKNLARWYGTGNTARGRIGDTGSVTPEQTLTGNWDDIDVKINPYADTSEFFFNGVSIGTLSHSSQGAGNAVGQIRFEAIDNNLAGGHYMYLETLRVGGS